VSHGCNTQEDTTLYPHTKEHEAKSGVITEWCAPRDKAFRDGWRVKIKEAEVHHLWDTILEETLAWSHQLTAFTSMCKGGSIQSLLSTASTRPWLRLLLRRVSEYMQTTKSADTAVFEEFLNYCKSLNIYKVLTRVTDITSVQHVTMCGYDPSKQKCFKHCCKGQFMLPQDEDMGLTQRAFPLQWNNPLLVLWSHWCYACGSKY
jgi:hypothetical protein